MENKESSPTQQSEDSAYLFDNAGFETPARFLALSRLYDKATIRHLEERGVGKDWHCLEVGGGGGSIATWLADRVGSTGHVLVTDIDPRFLETMKRPNLEVRRHDIVKDPLPEAAFDLVHARLVLMHLPERNEALKHMVAALKPGGWLVDEEFDSVSMLSDPSRSPGEVALKTHAAFGRLLANAGVERRMGRLLFARLRALGLVEVGTEARMFMWQSDSLGVSLMRANYEQARVDMIEAGYIAEHEFNEDMARLDDPNFMMPSPIMWTVWGRRPEV